MTTKFTYSIYRYVRQYKDYDLYHSGFKTKKSAIEYAEKNTTLIESGYKIVKEPAILDND